jgi:serine/threonine protein kinase
LGFIPPELFSGREPTKASDLYSLGASLLSLITGTPSTKMDRLLGEDFAFSADAFEGVERTYANWLRKMVAVRVSDRFEDARAALNAMDLFLSSCKEWGAQSYYSKTSDSISISKRVKLFKDKYPEPSLAPTGIALTKAEHLHLSRPEDKALELAYNRALDEHNDYLHYEFFNYGNYKADKWLRLRPWHLYTVYFMAVLGATGVLYFFFSSSITVSTNLDIVSESKICNLAISNIKPPKNPSVEVVEDAISKCDKAGFDKKSNEAREIFAEMMAGQQKVRESQRVNTQK